MGSSAEQYRRRQAAKKDLADITAHARSTAIVHYSCESFYDRQDGSSPRITSLAVRNLATGQTASFSIHQVAERDHVARDQIENEYNRLEKQMLDEFYKHMSERKDFKWLHWNMRDVNYGFPAIAHRYSVLGGTPVEIHDTALFDLARILIAMYGPGYTSHPRLTTLMKLNNISDKDFLTGEAEANAFVQKDYVKLHQSTLRKVDVMSNIFNRLTAGTLKTNAKKSEVYGSTFGYFIELSREHWIVVIVGILGSIASLISLATFFKASK